MDFIHYDKRNYPVKDVVEGYGEWSQNYDHKKVDRLDKEIRDRLSPILMNSGITRAADLACGTGRIGEWLKSLGVRFLDGVDLTPEMLEINRPKKIYNRLVHADIRESDLIAANYELVINAFSCDHWETLYPYFNEMKRLCKMGTEIIIIGYHPYFLLNGIPTHFENAKGEDIAVKNYIHNLSEFYYEAKVQDWTLLDFQESMVTDEWLEDDIRWDKHLGKPITFMFHWKNY